MEKHSENIKVLINNVKDKIGKPVSSRVVAATIESFGIRDIDTEADYGVSDIQDLANYVYRQLTTSLEHKESLNAKQREYIATNPETIQLSDYMAVKAKIFAQYYPLGIFHLLPVFLQFHQCCRNSPNPVALIYPHQNHVYSTLYVPLNGNFALHSWSPERTDCNSD